jgi:hypothetical protein
LQAGEKACLQKAFLILTFCIAVVHNAGTNTHLALSVVMLIRGLKQQGSDWHRQHEIT